MADIVSEACRQVFAETGTFPQRVQESAARLVAYFGDRRFGSIGADDLDAYVGQSAARNAGTAAFGIGGPIEFARYDIHILGTLAGFAGEIALWDLIQIWLEQNCASGAVKS